MNKLILDYVDAVSSGDYQKADDVATAIMNRYAARLSSISKVSNVEMPFFVAALKLVAEGSYNSMEPNDKRLCDLLMSGTKVVTVIKEEKEDENNE